MPSDNNLADLLEDCIMPDESEDDDEEGEE